MPTLIHLPPVLEYTGGGPSYFPLLIGFCAVVLACTASLLTGLILVFGKKKALGAWLIAGPLALVALFLLWLNFA